MSRNRKALAAVFAALLLFPAVAALFNQPPAEARSYPQIHVDTFDGTWSAATDILSADITPTNINGSASVFRITVAPVTTGTVFSVTVDDGSNTRTFSLNDGTSLDADEVYSFSLGVVKTYTYNFQATTATTGMLVVDEVLGEEF